MTRARKRIICIIVESKFHCYALQAASTPISCGVWRVSDFVRECDGFWSAPEAQAQQFHRHEYGLEQWNYALSCKPSRVQNFMEVLIENYRGRFRSDRHSK